MYPPSRSADFLPFSAARAGSWKPLLSFDVTKISSRGMPDASMASPTSFSLPYISAVSMWR